MCLQIENFIQMCLFLKAMCNCSCKKNDFRHRKRLINNIYKFNCTFGISCWKKYLQILIVNYRLVHFNLLSDLDN